MVYQLNNYNRRLNNQQITDDYEVKVYERLHSVLCDLAYLYTKEDQIARLEETVVWYKEQEKLILQRVNQGEVRYQVTKEVRNGVEVEVKEKNVS